MGVSRICAVPGCGVLLNKNSVSGCCRTHNHAVGFCACSKCRAEPILLRSASQDRPHVRTALIPPTGNGISGADSYLRISLPREPWLPKEQA